MNEATVFGQDLFGRFTVSEAMGIWNGYKAKWSEMAISPLVKPNGPWLGSKIFEIGYF